MTAIRFVVALCLTAAGTLPALAGKPEVRLSFGIDPAHPYILHYKTAAKMADLEQRVLDKIEPLLKAKFGFVVLVRATDPGNELRIEIADESNTARGSRPVFFRLKLHYTHEQATKATMGTTPWIFRDAARFRASTKDPEALAKEIATAVEMALNSPKRNDLVSGHLSALVVAKDAECDEPTGVFTLKVREDELGVSLGTKFKVAATEHEHLGGELPTIYDARYHGMTVEKKLRLLVEPPGKIAHIAQVREVKTKSVHVTYYEPPDEANAPTDRGTENAYRVSGVRQ